LREFSSLEVTVFHNDLEQAIRVLKKKLESDGLFRRLRAKRSYEKPSECRRRKRRESERRWRINRLKESRYSKE
jgi:small subunit ribosomal protein S21